MIVLFKILSPNKRFEIKIRKLIEEKLKEKFY